MAIELRGQTPLTLAQLDNNDRIMVIDQNDTVVAITTLEILAEWIGCALTPDGIKGLRDELNNRALSVHTHTISDITDLQNRLDEKLDASLANIVGNTIQIKDRTITIPTATSGADDARIPDMVTSGNYLRFLGTDGTIEERTIQQVRSDLMINNVDNTSDVDKPISTATQTALDGKLNKPDGNPAVTSFVSVASDGTVTYTNATGVTNLSIDRTSNEVTVVSSTGVDGVIQAATTNLAGVMSSADKTKLDGIENLADVTDTENVYAALGITPEGSVTRFLSQRGVFVPVPVVTQVIPGTGGIGKGNVLPTSPMMGELFALTEEDSVAPGGPYQRGIYCYDGTNWIEIGGAGGQITVEDEGIPLTDAATILDFVGSGVTATNNDGEVTVTIDGGLPTLLETVQTISVNGSRTNVVGDQTVNGFYRIMINDHTFFNPTIDHEYRWTDDIENNPDGGTLRTAVGGSSQSPESLLGQVGNQLTGVPSEDVVVLQMPQEGVSYGYEFTSAVVPVGAGANINIPPNQWGFLTQRTNAAGNILGYQNNSPHPITGEPISALGAGGDRFEMLVIAFQEEIIRQDPSITIRLNSGAEGRFNATRQVSQVDTGNAFIYALEPTEVINNTPITIGDITTDPMLLRYEGEQAWYIEIPAATTSPTRGLFTLIPNGGDNPEHNSWTETIQGDPATGTDSTITITDPLGNVSTIDSSVGSVTDNNAQEIAVQVTEELESTAGSAGWDIFYDSVLRNIVLRFLTLSDDQHPQTWGVTINNNGQTINQGDLTFDSNVSTRGVIALPNTRLDGYLDASNLPTTEPLEEGFVWNNSGILTVSEGADIGLGLRGITLSSVSFAGGIETATVTITGTPMTSFGLSITNTQPAGWLTTGALSATSGTIGTSGMATVTLTIPSTTLNTNRVARITATNTADPTNVVNSLPFRQLVNHGSQGDLFVAFDVEQSARVLMASASITGGDAPYTLELFDTDPRSGSPTALQSVTRTEQASINAPVNVQFTNIDTTTLDEGDYTLFLRVTDSGTGADLDVVVESETVTIEAAGGGNFIDTVGVYQSTRNAPAVFLRNVFGIPNDRIGLRFTSGVSGGNISINTVNLISDSVFVNNSGFDELTEGTIVDVGYDVLDTNDNSVIQTGTLSFEKVGLTASRFVADFEYYGVLATQRVLNNVSNVFFEIEGDGLDARVDNAVLETWVFEGSNDGSDTSQSYLDFTRTRTDNAGFGMTVQHFAPAAQWRTGLNTFRTDITQDGNTKTFVFEVNLTIA